MQYDLVKKNVCKFWRFKWSHKSTHHINDNKYSCDWIALEKNAQAYTMNRKVKEILVFFKFNSKKKKKRAKTNLNLSISDAARFTFFVTS
jgi:hypothetical protein